MSGASPTSDQAARAIRWIGLLCDASIAPEQLADLDRLVVEFPQIRKRYIELMSLHADMRQQAALLRPQDSTESSAIDAIVDLVTRQRKKELSTATRANTAPKTNAVFDDLNETMVFPAILGDSSELLEQDAAIRAPMLPAAPRVVTRVSWLKVAAIALPLITLSIVWALRSDAGPRHAAIVQNVTTAVVAPAKSGNVTASSNATTGVVTDAGPKNNRISPTPSSLCVVDLAINARWTDSSELTPKQGLALGLGVHNLKVGIVKLVLPGNATIVVEAPARFEVLSNKMIRLLDGKLCAQLIKGGGLTVLTPDLKAVDLGTEFALDVAAGKQTHLEVFQGAVCASAIHPTTSDAFEKLVAGDAVRVMRGSQAISNDTPRPLAFLRPSQVQSDDKTPYQRWARFSQSIREDRTLAAYYPFDSESASTNKLENRAQQTSGMYDGTMGVPGVAGSTPDWTQGRWPGKQALKFGGTQLKSVTINAQPGLISKSALTLCCWLNRADLHKPFDLLAGDVANRRSFNLGTVRGGSGDLIAFTWARYDVGPSPISFGVGQWKFLAIASTVEHGTQMYLDGKLISTNSGASTEPLSVNQLSIGAPASGNKLSDVNDYFNGAIDELFIFRRALSGEEIEHLYTMGLPD